MKNQNQKGITIVETLIAVSIFSIVSLGASKLISDIFSLNNISQSKLSAEQDVRKIIRPMVAEIRSANLSSAGAFPIEQAGTSSLIFFSDIDDDGLVDRLHYFLQGTEFKKGRLEPSGNPLSYNGVETVIVLMENIVSTSTPIFTYYDTNYTGTTSALTSPVNTSAVRLIKIKITIDEKPNQPPGPLTVQSQVSIRNLKDNL